MYFDFVSFKQSLQNYITPLQRELRNSYREAPIALTEFGKDCYQCWRQNKPKSVGETLSYLLFSPILLLALLCVIVWFAIYDPEAQELGWFSIGLYMIIYALTVPIAFILLVLFNLKFEKPATE